MQLPLELSRGLPGAPSTSERAARRPRQHRQRCRYRGTYGAVCILSLWLVITTRAHPKCGRHKQICPSGACSTAPMWAHAHAA
eukprot:scaffold11653_cov100-Isochrysis_galbana.AAC.3